MKFGLFGGATAKRGETTADSQSYQGFVDYITEAEQLGFCSIFLVEHHFTGVGQVSASLNLLSFIAARTSVLRLGTAVTVLPWHNPVLLAEQTATLDLLSDGRLDFGIGKGYRGLEFDGFCISKDEALERYLEVLEVLLKSWQSEERFSHDGKYWRFHDIIVEPPTVQKPHPPLWTGAGSPESIARTAADGMNLLLDQFGSMALTAERVKNFATACERAGRPFIGHELGLTRSLSLTRTDDERDAALDLRTERTQKIYEYGGMPGLPGEPTSYDDARLAAADASLLGNADEIAAKIDRLRGMGVEYILISITDSIDTLRFFAKEIMPAFAGDNGPGESIREFSGGAVEVN